MLISILLFLGFIIALKATSLILKCTFRSAAGCFLVVASMGLIFSSLESSIAHLLSGSFGWEDYPALIPILFCINIIFGTFLQSRLFRNLYLDVLKLVALVISITVAVGVASYFLLLMFRFT
ncbi:MAG: hypothetical protein QXQ11_08500 [Candidatus Bathyarchaeia archaeon]